MLFVAGGCTAISYTVSDCVVLGCNYSLYFAGVCDIMQ